MTTAFVLGGGGRWGAVEVGMLRALTEVGIQPDLIVGTSIGAFNGSVVADDAGSGAVRASPTCGPRSRAHGCSNPGSHSE